MLLRFLSSLKLTIALLLGLSAVSVIGTLKPAALGRYDLFYQSPWFRLGLLLLALNLAVCTVKTIRRNLRDRGRFLEILRSELVFGLHLRYVLPADTREEALSAGLSRMGYRVEASGECLVARRGLAGRWGSTVVHLSFLAIMLGALLAETGFVGTLNIYVGDRSEVYFDWDRQKDLPLGFEFRLDFFEPVYYPIDMKIGFIDPVTGAPLSEQVTREGETVALPTPGYSARVVRFLPDQKLLVLGIYREGRYLGEYHALPNEVRISQGADPGVKIVPTAFRDPMLKQLRAEVSVLEQGKVVKQGVIQVNEPLVYKGVAIYQTTYARDKFGFWSAGFQFSKDPGEPVVWVGCVTIVLGLLMAFFIPYRAVGVVPREGEVLLVALAGFNGEGGSADFDGLERSLATTLD